MLIVSTVLVISLSAAGARLNSDPCVIWAFSELLRATHPNVEVAAFVVDRGGVPTLMVWPQRASGHSQRFRGVVPDGTLAVVHTHFTALERPSPADRDESLRLGLPFYIVTHGALWLFDPESRAEVQVARGYAWVSRRPQQTCAPPEHLNRR